MALRIAEYLGERTDKELTILPALIPKMGGLNQVPLCPFNDQPCMKMRAKSNPKPPVCAVRKPDGQYFIVCRNRLISTEKSTTSEHQKDMLFLAAKELFSPNIERWQLGYKKEVGVLTGEGRSPHKADFVLAAIDPDLSVHRHRRILTEVQGGGETNNTGTITRHIDTWIESLDRSNELLSQPLKKPGTIETNAWRRLQEQLFAKATTARKTGYGFAVLLGDVVFDYMWKMIPNLSTIRLAPSDEWDVAFVIYKERLLQLDERKIGSVKLIVDPRQTFYASLEQLFAQMAKRGRIYPKAFSGTFTTLEDEIIELS